MTLTDTDPGLDLDRWHRSGDRAALERLMSASLDQAYTQARRTLGNAADAQDAVQEAMVQIMRSAHRFDAARPFAPWLARHVHDACCRLRWRARRTRAREQAVAQPDVLTPPEGVDAEAVRAAVSGLPERDRAAIELHYWAGLPQAEVARELGLSENALSVRLHRARERLRGLFARRGLSVGAAAMAAALVPTQAWAAPPVLAASVHGLGTAGALPATSIPLGALRETAWAAVRHPYWAAGAAMFMTGLIGLGVVLAHPGPPPAPPHAEVPPLPAAERPADTAWTAPARDILRWLNQRAPARAAVDLTAFRRSLAETRPLSLFADPQAKPALDRLRRLELAVSPNPLHLLFASGESGEGLAMSLRLGGHGCIAVSIPGADVPGFARRLQEDSRTLSPAPPDLGSPGWYFNHDQSGTLGMHGRFLVVGKPDAVRSQATAAAAAAATEVQPDLPAAAWARIDLGPTIAAFAAADPERIDPVGVGIFLGSAWRDLRPLVEATARTEAGLLVSDVRITRALPYTPFTIGMLSNSVNVPYSDRWWPIPPTVEVALRPADPTRLAPPPAGALFWATMGVEPVALSAALRGTPALTSRLPGLERLLPLCSGDISVAVEPGAPLPEMSVVLGLSGQPDLALINSLAGGFGLTAMDSEPGCQGAWQGFTPIGQVRVLLAAGRLVVSTASDPRRFLTPATSVPEAPLVAHADLPRLLATYGPLLFAQLGSERFDVNGESVSVASCLPPLPVLIRHLAAWHLAWTPTADGCHIHERGLPLLGALIAVGSLNVVSLDPAEETTQARPRREVLVAMQTHQERLAAATAAAKSLARGGPFTNAERAALRPLFAGRLPTDVEVRKLGTRYARAVGPLEDSFSISLLENYTGVVHRLDQGVYAVLMVTHATWDDIKLVGGNLRWAMPLGDGWSIGVTEGGAQVGLFKGTPPAADVPVEPHPDF